MKQRGRKSAASLAVYPGPRLVATAPPDDQPPPPPHLGAPEQQIWRDVLNDFKGTKTSLAVLASGLEAHQRARECRETIEAEGMTVTGGQGQTKAHPLCAVERDARAAFQRTFKSLGIKL